MRGRLQQRKRPRKRISLWLDEDLLIWLESEAQERKVSRGIIVSECVSDFRSFRKMINEKEAS